MVTVAPAATAAVASATVGGRLGFGFSLVWSVVAGVTADLEAAPEGLGSEIGRDRPVCLGPGQHRTAVIGAVARTALAQRLRVAPLEVGVVVPRPLLADWVEAVRPAGLGRRLRAVAGVALDEGSLMALDLFSGDIVVGVGARGKRRGWSRGTPRTGGCRGRSRIDRG